MKKKLLFKSLYEKKVDNITISKNENDINQISNKLEIQPDLLLRKITIKKK